MIQYSRWHLRVCRTSHRSETHRPIDKEQIKQWWFDKYRLPAPTRDQVAPSLRTRPAVDEEEQQQLPTVLLLLLPLLLIRGWFIDFGLLTTANTFFDPWHHIKIRSKGEPVNISRGMETLGAHGNPLTGFPPPGLAQTRLDERPQVNKLTFFCCHHLSSTLFTNVVIETWNGTDLFLF